MRFLIAITIAAFCASTAYAASDRPELKVKRVTIAQSDHEISGISLKQKKFLAVADGKKDHYIYKVDEKGTRFNLVPFIDLSTLKGYSQYKKEISNFKKLKKKRRRFDIEGLARCGDVFFLANEGVRQIIKIENKTLTKLPIDFSGYKELFTGGGNAGFEGLAVDCKSQTMYVAKERGPRVLFVIDMKSWKITRTEDIAHSNRQGQQVIDPFNGDGLFQVGPDFADLFFSGGFLYVLERNTYEVAKVDPATLKVLSRVSYYSTEKPLYNSGEPFGVAEALFLTKDEIVVGFDNNATPLSVIAEKKYKVSGNFGTIIYFERPKGF